MDTRLLFNPEGVELRPAIKIYQQSLIKNYQGYQKPLYMEIIPNIELEGKHGKTILTDVFYKDGRDAKPIVIFLHGFKGSKDWGACNLMARHFASKRFVFVKFNFSHNGTTPKN